MRPGSTTSTNPGLSVVVPVYNSAPTLPKLLKELSEELGSLGREFEVILVNDSSKDNSSTVIEELALSYDFIKAIELNRNYGQHNALLCGILQASYPLIVTLDDDLQHPPSEIHKLLDRLNEGFDVVYGVPEKLAHGLLRNLCSELTKIILQKAMGAEVARHVGAFRVFRTYLRNAFSVQSHPYVNLDVLLSWSTCKFAAVKVKHNPRQEGKSSYNVFRLFTHAANLLTGYSIIPLQIASLCGFVFLFLGFLALCYVLASYVIHGGTTVPGFAFLSCIILIFSAVQLLAIGIIGEYLARVYARVMGKPTYFVRDKSTSAVVREEQVICGAERDLTTISCKPPRA